MVRELAAYKGERCDYDAALPRGSSRRVAARAAEINRFGAAYLIP